MGKLANYVAIGLLAMGLSACDQKKDQAATDNQQIASQPQQTVSLMHDRLHITLPAGMSDQSGKLGTQANNMHVYADDSAQKTLIVIEGDNTRDTLATLSQRLHEKQRQRDPQLRVTGDRAISLNGHPAQQLDSVTSINNQPTWSSVILTKVDDKLVTLQLTLPADNQQQAQQEAQQIINTLTLR